MISILVPVAAAIIGALVYGLSANAKVGELARLLYGAGVLVALFVFAQNVVRL